jgi:hypothetical protein
VVLLAGQAGDAGRSASPSAGLFARDASPSMLRCGPAATLSYAIRAALKPWVTIPDHPRNACVTPM